MKFIYKNQILLAALFIFSIFLVKSFFLVDPDFFWHLKMGEIILQKEIPATDPFSYTMPSYSFVDHEWLSEVLIYLSHGVISWIGLSLVFSCLALGAILIPFLTKKKSLSSLVILLAGGALLPLVGVRPQIITWLFFSILITALLNKKYYDKLRFCLPLIFLLWANLHGGFAIGIAVFGVFVILRIWKERRVDLADILIFMLSLLATFINPYGVKLWTEIWKSMSDSSLRFSVVEWRPLFFNFNASICLYLALSLTLFWIFRKKHSVLEKCLFILLFLAGLSSMRHFPFWVIFSISIFSEDFIFARKKASEYEEGGKRFDKIHKVLLVITFFAIILPILFDFNKIINHTNNFFPVNAVNFLKKENPKGQIFADYDWGGYLILNYPEKKVFIDGRMPSWRQIREVKSESNYAFDEYRNILSGDLDFKTIASKYDINTALLMKENKSDGSFAGSVKQIINSPVVGKSGTIYSQLRNAGWKIIYEDNTAVVFKKIGG